MNLKAGITISIFEGFVCKNSRFITSLIYKIISQKQTMAAKYLGESKVRKGIYDTLAAINIWGLILGGIEYESMFL